MIKKSIDTTNEFTKVLTIVTRTVKTDLYLLLKYKNPNIVTTAPMPTYTGVTAAVKNVFGKQFRSILEWLIVTYRCIHISMKLKNLLER